MEIILSLFVFHKLIQILIVYTVISVLFITLLLMLPFIYDSKWERFLYLVHAIYKDNYGQVFLIVDVSLFINMKYTCLSFCQHSYHGPSIL